MRIAQFTESYRPVINGVAVAVDLLVDAFEPEHSVEVFAPHFPGHQDLRPAHRFSSYAFPHQRDYPLAIPWSPRLRRKFGQSGFDVVHTHSPFALGQVGRRWARQGRIPLVTTYHTLYVEYSHYAPFLPKPPLRHLLRQISLTFCNACDVVAVPTEPVRQELVSYGVQRPIRVIPTGLKLRPPRPRDPDFPRRAFGIPEEAPLALYAGRLAKEKNLGLLFSGFARVAREMPDAWLLIAGGGPVEAEARRMAQETGAGDRIVFAGFVPPEKMELVYAAVDVFAFSSRTDTQGLVLTEAKAAGVPAVSVNAYGPSTVVTDGLDGFLIPDDPEPFAGALVRILSDRELRARMSGACLREVGRFSIDATAEAYLRLYQEAAELNARAG